MQTLLISVEAATKSATPASALPVLGKQVDALAASVTGKGLAPYFPRELRDLDDVREKLALCRAAAGYTTVRLRRGYVIGWQGGCWPALRCHRHESDVGRDRGRQLESQGHPTVAVGSLLGWIAAGVLSSWLATTTGGAVRFPAVSPRPARDGRGSGAGRIGFGARRAPISDCVRTP